MSRSRILLGAARRSPRAFPRAPLRAPLQTVQYSFARPAQRGFGRRDVCPSCHLPLRSSSTEAWQRPSFSPTWIRRHSYTVPAFRGGGLGDDATIYALSSAPGKAGIAVIRISGPACLHIYRALCPTAADLKPRYAAVRTLHGPKQAGDGHGREARQEPAAILDTDAVVLYFPGPKTVTGEDVLELHVHGGPATVRAILSAIPRCAHVSSSSIRYAEPGEFTRRAFLHDRLDLAQVEALGDTLDAQTEQQRRAAVAGRGHGQLGRTYDGWRETLLAARGEIEALIDFAEDQHFDESPAQLLSGVVELVRDRLLRALAAHEAAGDRASLLRQGIRLALVGPANAGKSSLMNLIVGREASIVSAEAGTTRDVVEASLDLRGYLCTFADTAGFRQQEMGAIEAEGMRRARQKAAHADVVLVLASVEAVSGVSGVSEVSKVSGDISSDISRVTVHFDAETLALAAQAQKYLVVLNKSDLASAEQLADLQTRLCSAVQSAVQSAGKDSPATIPLVTVSCREAEVATTGHPAAQHSAHCRQDPGGIRHLVDTLAGTFASMTELPPDEQHLLGVTVRQQQLLAQCRHHLYDFLVAAGEGPESHDPDIVLAAEHLRYAADCLARITGRGESGDIEEVLGIIFEKFCVGK